MMEDNTAFSCGHDLVLTEPFELDLQILTDKPSFPSLGLILGS